MTLRLEVHVNIDLKVSQSNDHVWMNLPCQSCLCHALVTWTDDTELQQRQTKRHDTNIITNRSYDNFNTFVT